MEISSFSIGLKVGQSCKKVLVRSPFRDYRVFKLKTPISSGVQVTDSDLRSRAK